MYKVYKGDSCDFLRKTWDKFRVRQNLFILIHRIIQKEIGELENITMIVICCGRFLLVI